MATHGKADRTGRSSGRPERKERSLIGPPQGEPWLWITAEQYISPAWCTLSRHSKRFIEALLVEHANHAGRENGRLAFTYDQLVAFGIPRKRIKPAIDEAVAHGFVERIRTGGRYGLERKNTTSLYRLTWIGCLNPSRPATNEWKRFSAHKTSQTKSNSSVTHVGTVYERRAA